MTPREKAQQAIDLLRDAAAELTGTKPDMDDLEINMALGLTGTGVAFLPRRHQRLAKPLGIDGAEDKVNLADLPPKTGPCDGCG